MSLENLRGERWKVIEINGEQTKYFVSNKGRLSNGKKCLSCTSIKNKYILCDIRHNNKSHKIRLHRLVAIAFKKNPRNLPQVNHKDGKKNNNAASNLEWCTAKHNIIHSFELGLCVRPKGKNSHLFDKGRKVFDKNSGITYPSVATAARELKIPRTTISAEINGFRPNKYNLIGL